MFIKNAGSYDVSKSVTISYTTISNSATYYQGGVFNINNEYLDFIVSNSNFYNSEASRS